MSNNFNQTALLTSNGILFEQGLLTSFPPELSDIFPRTASSSSSGNLQQRPINDFNQDGKTDILWRHNGGMVHGWILNGTQIIARKDFEAPGQDWQIQGLADFNQDGKTDILWRHNSGMVHAWILNGTQVIERKDFEAPGQDWQIQGLADFNQDGKTDILWRHNSGMVHGWILNGTQIIARKDFFEAPGQDWQIQGLADFNQDGKTDILWRHNGGMVHGWILNGTQIIARKDFEAPGQDWQIQGLADFNQDGKIDILWRHNSGMVHAWILNGTQVLDRKDFEAPGQDWQIVSPFNKKASKADRLQVLLNKSSSLTIDEIQEFRKLTEQKPQTERSALLRQLQYKTPYFNQRDNSNPALADVQCNVTTLASILTFLGVQNPNQARQFEDVLESMLQANPTKYPSTQGINARYWWNNFQKLAGEFGVSSSGVKMIPGFSESNINFFKDFVRNNWEAALNQGQGIMAGVSTTIEGHIVKIIDIDWNRGLIVDDPYGRAQDLPGSNYKKFSYSGTQNTKNRSAINTQQGQDESGFGNDNLWSWAFCAEIFGETAYMIFGDSLFKGGASSVSEAGLRFISRHEGMRLQLYNDPAGNATIGVGHLVHLGPINGSEPIEFRNGITEARALKLLRQDADKAVQAVKRYITVPLTQAQFDALVSFTFNLGVGTLEGSALRAKLNAGDYSSVPQQLNLYVNANGKPLPGLIRRRQEEGELFTNGTYA
jgi:GH24 family phage-related lysozyme (muramidase)